MGQKCMVKQINSPFWTLLPFLTLLFLHPILVSAQCGEQETCDECIRTKGCIWCKDPNIQDSNLKRCTLSKGPSMDLRNCKSWEKVDSNITRIINGRRPDQAKIDRDGHMSPQQIDITLAVGVPVTIELQYQHSKDKPLDLYYLMDLSHTMSDDRATVAQQSQDLANKLKRITKDVQFGFGSFVDKPVMPFASTAQLESTSKTVEAPYSFRNHLKLTHNTTEFEREVKSAKNSSNLDEPEGSLDAIMQAIACTKEIGWRNESRKLLIMSTDGPFHIAGDGKLAGIVRPHDMECHLENDRYTHEKILDYPSIGQLNAKVQQKQVNIIFAVTKNQEELYKKLSGRVGSSTTVTLKSDSSDVVEVIRKEYQKILGTVTLSQFPDSIPGLLVTYDNSDCGKEKPAIYNPQSKPVCENVQPAQKKTFKITFELQEKGCPFSNQQVKIRPFDQLELTVNIKAICDCPCKSQVEPGDISHASCHQNGNLTCGICSCDARHAGKNCECKIDGNTKNDDSACIDSSSVLCSGRGTCICGKCQCNRVNGQEIYKGALCQYDTNRCKAPKSNLVCTGHGTCDTSRGKEECKCDPDFEGTYCNCKKGKMENCQEPGTSQICNGRGVCECEKNPPEVNKVLDKKCQCNQGSSYKGAYCHTCDHSCSEESPICSDNSIVACIACLDKMKALEDLKEKSTIEGSSPSPGIPADCKKKCMESLTTRNITFQLSVDEGVGDGDSAGAPSEELVRCEHLNEEGCKIQFRYYYEGRSTLRALVSRKNEDACPKTPWWIIGAVVGSILLIGILLLLIWKIVTHIHDSREYQRFEKEREGTKWGGGDNPLYTGPSSHFVNPLRNRRSQMPAATVAQTSH